MPHLPTESSLFNDVVEILDLADLDSRAMVGVVTDDRRRVGAAFVDRDLLRNTMTTDGLAQEAQRRFTILLGCQQLRQSPLLTLFI